jgi:predicted enzyme related to lactoylglutathione lyase
MSGREMRNRFRIEYQEVDDVHASVAQAQAAGATILVAPVERPFGKFAWVQTADGSAVGYWSKK